MAECAGEHGVRILRVHHDARDASGLLQAHQGPRFPGICGLVDALSEGDVAPDLPFARARPDDVLVRPRHRERSDRLHRMRIEERAPVHTAVGGLPDPARGCAHVVGERIARDTGRRAEAVPLRAEIPPVEILPEIGGEARGRRSGRSLGRERCGGQKRERGGRQGAEHRSHQVLGSWGRGDSTRAGATWKGAP